MTIKNRFPLLATVYLIVGGEQPGRVTAIIVTPNGHHYGVTWGDGTSSEHYEAELAEDKAYGVTDTG